MRPAASSRTLDVAIAVALALATLAVYAGVRHHDFVNYDDPAYVTDNPRVRDGLSWDGLIWALGATAAANWHPLTWLSHMADVEIFGREPGPHHLVSLALHAANAVLAFTVLRRLTHALWPSAFVAAAFALHPLHVESVAWVAERKDVLSTFCGLLALSAYERYARRPGSARYAAVVLWFALGLAAKPMLVSLPLVLLCLDFWPLGRRAVLEKLPLLALSAGSAAITLVAQRAGGALLPVEAIPLGVRLANAAVSYVRYLGKILWPAGLAVPYPYPSSLPWWEVGGSVLVVAAVTVAAVLTARRFPYVLAGWSWYLVMLLPVIGIVQVGDQALADRYTYLPSVGILVALACGTADLWRAWPRARGAIAVAAPAALVVLAAATGRQVAVWSDTETLFRHALEVTEGNYVAHTYLGIALAERGEVEEAIRHLEAVGEMGAVFADAPYTLGQIYEARGEIERATGYYALALAARPDHPGALVDLGRRLEASGRVEQALAHYERARALVPDDAPLLNNLGAVLTRLGRAQEALEPLERAARLDPGNVETWNNLAVAYLDLGRVEDATRTWTEALDRDPGHVPSLFNLGVAAQRAGRLDEALARFEQALGREPRSARVLAALGDTRARMGDAAGARDAYERALGVDPGDAEIRQKIELLAPSSAPI